MYIDKIFNGFVDVMSEIRDKENNCINEAVELISRSIKKGGYFFVYDRGHMLSSELIARSGGAAFVRKLELVLPQLQLSGMAGSTALMRNRHTDESLNKDYKLFEDEYLRHLFIQNGFKSGDVLLINSVSGKNPIIYNMAKLCRELDIKVIAIASLETNRMISNGNGKSFIDVADIVIDNHIKYGDALFKVDNIDEKLVSASGIAAVFIGWSIVYGTACRLADEGICPTIYRSVNIEGGEDQNQAAIRRFNKCGY